MEQLKFKLDSFEGPLDLLLMLIRKNKVSIYDIPISLILDQYLSVMTEMQEMDLEVSSEFLVLAATLLQIKSKMLLPKPEEDEDNEDPREELVRRLEEYRKVKKSIEFFRDRQNIGTLMYFKAPDAIEKPLAELNTAPLTPENLIEAYRRAYQRLERKMPPPKHSFDGIVGYEKVSVRSRVSDIWNKFKSKSKILFKDLFKGTKSKAEAVASFLAVLELIKIKKIRIEYTEAGGISNPDIYKMSDSDIDLNVFEE